MTEPHTEQELREVFDGAPQRVQRLLNGLDPAAQSGTESVTRHRLRSANIQVRSQVTIAEVGTVDLLVIIDMVRSRRHRGRTRV